ncbi:MULTISPECIES: ABC transporter ATP-binding protein [Pseudomonas]|jgi:ABC-type cobalamin/Fe3+-siderophores transport system ATPase subunit|uniref:ABC transporter ATP-binding protein n=1 Tax=Serpens gallinarum TaxID=2763075 RepID=A0ABR8TJJ1_9PSED|nr:ABC transporter ATP-binding protein [Serpens gallinarum]MBD7975946.1 ABC transporter ATP-binding protein [Serpens gallinarum]
MDLIRLERVSVPGRLEPVRFSLAAGEMLGLIGPNGAGKSTLLNALAGIQPHTGSLSYFGFDAAHLSPKQRAQRIGFLPQSHHSAWSLSVEDVVALGRLPWGDEDAALITSAMQRTGVLEWRTRKVAELSGGEQARVWLARVLAGQPVLLLADEPIASLDLRHQRKVMELLRDHAHQDRSVVLSIHDLGLAARYCDKLCLLAEGQVLAYGTPQEVLTEAHITAAFQVDVHIDLTTNPPIILPK